jgi:hypothetical protein
MTTEIQTTITPKHSEITSTTTTSNANFSLKMSTTLEERKGNAIKPLSLRPNRSVKKNISLKPLGLRSR